MENFSVTIVILATDETKSLEKTVHYIANKCSYKPDRILVVLSRSASKECVKTCELLKKIYNDYLEVSVQEKEGLGNAVRYGVKCTKTTHMIFFPADLAIELESIDRMIFLSKQYPEAIIKTSRWLRNGDFIGYGRIRLVLNRLAQSFLKIIFSTKLTDLTNPVQIIPVDYEKRIRWQEEGFAVLLEQTVVPIRLGFFVKEVPAKCLPRTEGKSKNSVRQTATYLKTAIRIRFTPKSKLYK